MKAGAVEFLTKPFNDDVLLRTIQQCVERSRAVLREQAEMRVLRERYESLTPREREVMALVVTGLLNKQVGGELGISEITVKAHRGQLMRKMQADSLAGLVTMTRQAEAADRRTDLKSPASSRRHATTIIAESVATLRESCSPGCRVHQNRDSSDRYHRPIDRRRRIACNCQSGVSADRTLDTSRAARPAVACVEVQSP